MRLSLVSNVWELTGIVLQNQWRTHGRILSARHFVT